jgi:hypothetical protein
MKIIEIEANIIPRKAYVIEADEQQYLEFTNGIEVLPAMYYETNHDIKFYFRKRHEDGEPGWRGGGYECVEGNGAKRAFHLDSLIVHPRYFKHKEKTAKILKSKSKRGRPKIDPALKKTPTIYIPTGGKRGRPKIDPVLKKSIVYIKTNRKRGRPRKNS